MPPVNPGDPNVKTTSCAALGLAAALVLASCAVPSEPPATPGADGDAAALAARGEAAHIHNLAEIAPGLFRGAQPEGDAAFALLRELGVRTVLSVDGARPDVEGAAKHGIRYVHVPVEYSGIPREHQVRIAKVAVDLPGPLFVHCHHGKHRGPAASGMAWMARDGVAPEKVVADMRRAGTDPRYAGLYGDVVAWRPVTAEERAAVGDADLPSAAKVPDFVGAMVQVDQTFDRMKAVKKAGWRTPAEMPDVQPSHEARILAERFREIGRLEEVRRRKDDFRGWLSESESAAWDLEKAIEGGDHEAAAKSLDRVGTTCNSCHGVYRNTK
jgi:protein tyrosine phosphatase (PTP) superfamily phosphohydrolase (DUF442 family)/cytochrome c556